MLALSLWRFVVRSPWFTLMAISGICLGVTSVVSVHLISEQVNQQLQRLQPEPFRQYTHFLHQPSLHADEYIKLLKAWRRGEHPELQSMAPVIDEQTLIKGHMVRVLGIDLVAAGGRLVSQQTQADLPGSDLPGNEPVGSQQPFAWDGVWLDEAIADVVGRPVNGLLTAVPRSTGADEGAPAIRLIIADIAIAQELLAWPTSRISYVAVRANDRWRWLKKFAEQLVPGLRAGLPAHLPSASGRLHEWQVLSAQQQHPASQFGNAILFNVSALAILAMLVAWFLIYQVAVSWQRKLLPTLQRLHLLGVSWGGLSSCFIGMLALVGMAGGLLGLVSGQLLAQWLYLLVATEAVALKLSAWAITKGLLSAVAVGVFGGAWAIFAHQRQLSLLRATVILLLLGGVVWWGIMDSHSGLPGAFAAVAALSWLTVFLIQPSLWLARRWSGRISGPPLLVNAVREVVWHPKDLATAIGGLTLAVATAIGVATMVDSFRADFAQFLQQRLAYDVVVRGEHDALAALLAPDVADQFPQIETVQAYYQGEIRVAGTPVALTTTTLNNLELARYLKAPALASFNVEQVLVSEQLARQQQLSTGGTIQVAGENFLVAGVFQGFGDLQPRLIVDHQHPLANHAGQLRSVSLQTGGDTQAPIILQQAYPALVFRAQEQVRATALRTFDETFAITGVLITIALLVAAIGIYVATSTLRLNQRTSSRLLATMGVSWWEMLGTDLARALAIGITAVVMAVPLGLGLGYILCELVNPRAFGWTVQMQVSTPALAGPVLWGCVAALAAGVLRLGQDEEGRYELATQG